MLPAWRSGRGGELRDRHGCRRIHFRRKTRRAPERCPTARCSGPKPMSRSMAFTASSCFFLASDRRDVSTLRTATNAVDATVAVTRSRAVGLRRSQTHGKRCGSTMCKTVRGRGGKRRFGQGLQVVFRDGRGRQITERGAPVAVAHQIGDTVDRIFRKRWQPIDYGVEYQHEGFEEPGVELERFIEPLFPKQLPGCRGVVRQFGGRPVPGLFHAALPKAGREPVRALRARIS